MKPPPNKISNYHMVHTQLCPLKLPVGTLFLLTPPQAEMVGWAASQLPWVLLVDWPFVALSGSPLEGLESQTKPAFITLSKKVTHLRFAIMQSNLEMMKNVDFWEGFYMQNQQDQRTRKLWEISLNWISKKQEKNEEYIIIKYTIGNIYGSSVWF